MAGNGRTSRQDAIGFSRLAPSVVARQRLVERAGRRGGTVMTVAVLVGIVLVATAVLRSPWALLPVVVLAPGMTLGPLAIRKGAHPEYIELLISLCLTIAMATAAALTGGASSPIVYLFPIGVVLNALRAGPTGVALCAAVTIAAFVIASLLNNAAAVSSHLLAMLAIAAMQAAVTVVSIALAQAELSHRKASIIDPLTGLLNRQGLHQRFDELRQQATVSGAPITLVLFDLDHFKRVNDVHGHDVGDRLLVEVAEVTRKTLRRFELVYRIGGEEFLIVLPGMEEWEGESLAEELRIAIGKLVPVGGLEVTASFGVSGASGAAVDFEELYRRADQALYQAKRGGRDRVQGGVPATLS